MKKVKQWLKYRRIVKLVEAATRNAFYMQHWGRVHNLHDRLDRVKGNDPQYHLRYYQQWKIGFVADLGFIGLWHFDPYTLT